MNKQIENLIQLQTLDSKIIKLQIEKQNLPRRKDEERNLYEDFKNQMKQIEEELKKLKLKHKEREVDLKSKEEGVKKLQLQLYQVKDNRSYQALQSEISSTSADNSIIEEEILELLDEIDNKEKEVEEKRQHLNRIQLDMQRHLDEIENQAKHLEEEIEDLKNERQKYASSIETSILNKYEKILHNKKDSLAVVPVKNGSCQGCFMTLPPQIISELKLGNKLITCQNCSRILYMEE